MIKKRRLYPVILLISIIFGHLWVLFPQMDLGLALTVYRVMIPVFTIYSFSQYCRNNGGATKSFNIFLGSMGIWIIWGFFLLIYSTYSAPKEGIKEILSVLLGVCSVVCVYKSVNDEKDLKNIITVIKVSVLFLVLMAWFETFTNWHLSSSSLIEDEYVVLKLGGMELFGSSTIFYNVNDFYAFLAIMSTLFFEKFYKISGIFILMSSFLLMVLNDANICLIAMAGAFLVFWLVRVRSVPKKIVIVALLAMGCIICNTMLASRLSLYSVKDIFYIQMENAQMGMGSLYQRLTIYVESIGAVLKTHGLGLGPAGFTSYFLVGEHMTKLINPHNYWLEILSQYGIAVFGLYVGVYIREVWLVFKIYRERHCAEAAIIVAMCASFIVASIAPSSFLTYQYQWIVIALCLALEKVAYGKKK